MKAEKFKAESLEWINRGSKLAKDLSKNAKSYSKVVSGYIKKYPVQSTMVGVTVGIILGKIFKR